MNKRKGFTLIELLVVISVIALLMAILMPALRRAKRQAQNVICQSNLRQWGICFELYASDNRRFFNEGMWGNWGTTDNSGCWVIALRPYYDNEKFLLCPTTTKSAHERNRAWGAFQAWHISPDALEWGTLAGVKASYGNNRNCTNPPPRAPALQSGTFPIKNYYRSPDVKGASNIPLLLDCYYMGTHPQPYDAPPAYDGQRDGSNNMNRICLNRHNGATNGVFVDFSVSRIPLKKLWVLKWNREYDTCGPWTRAGGCTPVAWPEWMRGLKEY